MQGVRIINKKKREYFEKRDIITIHIYRNSLKEAERNGYRFAEEK